MAIIAVSCNQSSTKNNEQSTVTSDVPAIQEPSKENDSETSTDNEAIAKAGNFSISPIITDYLTLKNALVSDDDKAAANAGKALLATFNKVDMNTIPADKHKEYMDIADDAKEHAEHIGDNVGNIAHQREHLAVLSEDVKDLIALFGTSKKLYQDHCPMFNDGKGAIWLSESKEIKNPYYGSEMLTCGNVQQELK
uniref:Putative Co/Zn/Cd efflux system membrane fusion protein n=2 Tax=Weeksellaceae TaxID=2762318 RepID=A0A455ZCI6_9FLAO|nr:TPA_exp: putative Co/Zn/Cd efflux system membrane fusion protein [Elizabethkingia anophelis]